MWRTLLFPFSLVYGFITAFRNRLYDFKLLKSVEFDIPVISVGNITVGGTGKTPHTEYLIRLLQSRFSVATLSRGYMRKSKGFRIVETTSGVEESGDEPLQIKKKFPNITVAVCENRVTGVQELLRSETPPDVVLLDDAFQHRRISPGINIVLIDYNKPLKEDRLLPAGRLRENQMQLRRANIIIITKCPSEIKPITRRIMAKDVFLFPYQELYFTKMTYGSVYPVFPGPPVQQNLFSNTAERGILLVAGIASPDSIIEHVKTMSKEVETAIFPDHHNYSPDDILMIIRKFDLLKSSDKIIVTTEKDIAKLISHDILLNIAKESIYCLPLQVRFLDQEGKLFDKKIKEYVGENKSNRELHFKTDKHKG
jgi:tetraacyldisaccharide 4'-kinase